MKSSATAVIAIAAMAEVAHAFSATPSMPLRQTRTTSPAALSSLSMVKVTVDQKGQDKSFEMDKDEVLRTGMKNAGVDVYYTMKGKLLNCNGGGQCGTCKVELVSGKVSGRTAAENKLLAKDPATFRLACQTLVEGPCSIRNMPDA